LHCGKVEQFQREIQLRGAAFALDVQIGDGQCSLTRIGHQTQPKTWADDRAKYWRREIIDAVRIPSGTAVSVDSGAAVYFLGHMYIEVT
jgi:hypothetical protein